MLFGRGPSQSDGTDENARIAVNQCQSTISKTVRSFEVNIDIRRI